MSSEPRMWPQREQAGRVSFTTRQWGWMSQFLQHWSYQFTSNFRHVTLLSSDSIHWTLILTQLNTRNRKCLLEAKATYACDDRQTPSPIAQGHKCQRHLGWLLPDSPDAPIMMEAQSNHPMSQPLQIWSIIADTWLPCSRELAAVRFGMWNILSEGRAGLGWKLIPISSELGGLSQDYFSI